MEFLFFMILYGIVAVICLAAITVVGLTYVTNHNYKTAIVKFVLPRYQTLQIITTTTYITNTVGGQLFSFNFPNSNTNSTITFQYDRNWSVGVLFMVDCTYTNVGKTTITSTYYVDVENKTLNVEINGGSIYIGYLLNIEKKMISGYFY